MEYRINGKITKKIGRNHNTILDMLSFGNVFEKKKKISFLNYRKTETHFPFYSVFLPTIYYHNYFYYYY